MYKGIKTYDTNLKKCDNYGDGIYEASSKIRKFFKRLLHKTTRRNMKQTQQEGGQ